MECLVNNTQVPIDRISYRDLGFGEKLIEVESFIYTLTLGIIEFTSIIEKQFNEFVIEMKQDDEVTGDTDYLGLFERGYPCFQQLIQTDTEYFLDLVKRFLFFELLQGCFTELSAEKWIYIINSINDIYMEGSTVKISGDAFKKQG